MITERKSTDIAAQWGDFDNSVGGVIGGVGSNAQILLKSNPRYGHPTDANGNTVVDDNHVHNEGEAHFELLAFDRLYGGGQGVYGQPTHDGVTVIYNNK